MSDSPALEVTGLTKGYGGKLAVDGLSFSVSVPPDRVSCCTQLLTKLLFKLFRTFTRR